MKILVPVKRVPDPETVIKLAPDGTSIVTDNVKWVINPFDEIAIEEALRIKEKLAGTEKPDLILLGKQAIDDDSNCVGQMLAELLGWPQATFASKIEIGPDQKSARVTREVDGGLETVAIPLPAVVTADLRLNEPRYASLPGIMKARKKELKEIPLADVGADVTPRTKVVKLETPPKRTGGRKVASVQELVKVLHDEAKVI